MPNGPQVKLTQAGALNPTLVMRHGGAKELLQPGESALLQLGDSFAVLSTRPQEAFTIAHGDTGAHHLLVPEGAGTAVAAHGTGPVTAAGGPGGAVVGDAGGAAVDEQQAGGGTVGSTALREGRQCDAGTSGGTASNALQEPSTTADGVEAAAEHGRQQQQQQPPPQRQPVSGGSAAAQPGTGTANSPTSALRPVMLLLIGLPGAGKSYFAKALVAGGSQPWVRVNQDTVGRDGRRGSRQMCLRTADRALRSGANVVIDRTNLTPEQRIEFVQLAQGLGCKVHGLALQLPPTLCAQRAAARLAEGGVHEGGVQGKGSASVVYRMHSMYSKSDPPKLAEGFTSLRTCQSDAEAAPQLRRWQQFAGGGAASMRGVTAPGPPAARTPAAAVDASAAVAVAPGGVAAEAGRKRLRVPRAASSTPGGAAGGVHPAGASAAGPAMGTAPAAAAGQQQQQASMPAQQQPRQQRATGQEQQQQAPVVRNAFDVLMRSAACQATSPARAGARRSRGGAAGTGAAGPGGAAHAAAAARDAGAGAAAAAAAAAVTRTALGPAAAAVAAVGSAGGNAGPAAAASARVGAGADAGAGGSTQGESAGAALGGGGAGGVARAKLHKTMSNAAWAQILYRVSQEPDRHRDSQIILHVDDAVVLLRDGYPKAAQHVLLLARQPGLDSVAQLRADDLPLLRHMRRVALAWIQQQQQELQQRQPSEQQPQPNEQLEGLQLGTSAGGAASAGASAAASPSPSQAPGAGAALGSLAQAAALVADDALFPAGYQVGFHSLPSMRQLHLHVMTTDFDSPCLKTKQHWNSFTTKFFLSIDDVLRQLQHVGRVHVDAAAAQQLLACPLRCCWCGQVQRNMPALKVHVQQCRTHGVRGGGS